MSERAIKRGSRTSEGLNQPVETAHLIDIIFEWNNEFITEKERQDLAAAVFSISPEEGVVLMFEFLRSKGIEEVEERFSKLFDIELV